VRSGVLEALGEVIYTFHEDADGPPEALVHLFLGPKEDPSLTKDRHRPDSLPTPLELFYSDPKRPLICAFNFPAVALTLGGQRWSELRETYLDLTTNATCGVCRTLAASLGELAKIIGTDNTQKDLLNVWWLYIDFEDEGVRTKALESLYDIIGVVGNEIGRTLAQGLLTRWGGGTFRGWRERETVLNNIVGWVNRIGLGSAPLARGLLLKGLEDNVAAVREAAIVAVSVFFSFPCSLRTDNFSQIPEVWILFSSQQEVIDDLGGNLRQLATSTKYRKRMTYVLLNCWSIQIMIYPDSFIASQQALALAVDGNGRPVISHIDDDFLSVVANLADDTIEGVRIAVARFAAAIHSKSCSFWLSIMVSKSSYCEITGNLVRQSHAIPSIITDLVHRLSQDSSHEVQSYVVDLTTRRRSVTSDDSATARCSQKRLTQLSTFSRPPQPHISDQPLGDGMLVEEPNFSGDSADSGGLRSLHTHHPVDGNESLIPEDMSHAGGLPPPNLCVYNRAERFGNTRERVTVPG
jgi:serine/threonine-protein phosphatase 4 regulatory subunit 1